MGFFSVVALILIAAKAFGFLAIGWLWCFAPILVDVALVFPTMGFGLFAAKKARNIVSSNMKHTSFDEVLNKAKDRLG